MEIEPERHQIEAPTRSTFSLLFLLFDGSAVLRLLSKIFSFSSRPFSFSLILSSSPPPLFFVLPPLSQPLQVRADLNVPLDKDLKITDDTRIRAAIPTLKYLVDNGAKVLLTSHLGRPKDGPEDKFRLNPVVPRLQELLKGTKVGKVDDCIGESVAKAAKALGNGKEGGRFRGVFFSAGKRGGMKGRRRARNKLEEKKLTLLFFLSIPPPPHPSGELLVLENVRFYKAETKNEPDFAKALAANADIYVNDAFGTAHRAHGSTEGVTKYLSPSVAGFCMQKELDYLDGAVAQPKRPFAAIVGGSKVSSKIGVIETLINKVDKIFLGGGMIFTFYKAQGKAVGASLVEEDKLDLARELIAMAEKKGVQFILPTDVIVADKFAADAKTQVVSIDAIPDGWMGLDIGPDSLKAFQAALSDCKQVIWNGPMGVFEMDAFAKGTYGVAETLAELTPKGTVTIIGGGDSVAAVEKAGLADKMSHISTGGGASLELLEGKVLPGVAALDEALVAA